MNETTRALAATDIYVLVFAKLDETGFKTNGGVFLFAVQHQGDFSQTGG